MTELDPIISRTRRSARAHAAQSATDIPRQSAAVKHAGSRSAGLSLAWACCLALLGCASAPQYRIAVAASLRPVDTSRPMVVFSQIRGEACGRDAVVGALRQMKRLRPIDGYLELVVEETGSGDERCARTTAYPFRYGTDASLPELRVAPPSTDPELVPGASATLPPTTAPVFDCVAACTRATQSIAGSVARALAEDRCLQRCGLPDIAFQACIAQVAEAAVHCLAP